MADRIALARSFRDLLDSSTPNELINDHSELATRLADAAAAAHWAPCPLCRGVGDVLLAPVGAAELLARVRCPHCGPLHLQWVRPVGTDKAHLEVAP